MSLNKIFVNNTQIVSVDEEPTSGSDNLVKSSGVFSSISEETARATAAEQINTKTTFNAASISVVWGLEIEPNEIFESKVIQYTGSFYTHNSYATRRYSVTSGQKLKVKGSIRGDKYTGCYALYTNEEITKDNLFSIYTIGDFAGNDLVGSTIVKIDNYIEIPEGVTTLATCSTEAENRIMLAYDVKNTKDYVDEKASDTYTKSTDFAQSIASISVVEGTEVVADETLEQTCILDTGALFSNSSYTAKKYNVSKGQKFKIKGSCRGTMNVACYAFYNNTEISPDNLVYIYTIRDFVGGDFSGSQRAVIDHFVEIPVGVVMVAVVNVTKEGNNAMYNLENTKDYVDGKLRKIKYVDCLGDSLTMGATRFGWYEDTLQELLGDEYKVRNWGVGGESSGSIMARQGSDCIKFQEDWILKADKSATLVMNNDGQDILIRTQKYNTTVSLLLQGAENDSGQKTRVVNPCYINGIECTMTHIQGSAFAKGSWYINRNQTGEKDITIPANTPVYFNTGKEMGKSEITIIWMGTNDGSYSDWQTLVDKQIMASNKVSNKKFIVIGLHKIGGTGAKTYESLMRNAFGNKFF